MPENKKNGKKVYVRPEDVAELIYEVSKKVDSLEKLRAQIERILWYLKNEKFDKLQAEFNIDP